MKADPNISTTEFVRHSAKNFTAKQAELEAFFTEDESQDAKEEVIEGSYKVHSIRHVDAEYWPDPTAEDLEDPRFEAIWNVIKNWDINVPTQYDGYCGASGNHVVAILNAVKAVIGQQQVNEFEEGKFDDWFWGDDE